MLGVLYDLLVGVSCGCGVEDLGEVGGLDVEDLAEALCLYAVE